MKGYFKFVLFHTPWHKSFLLFLLLNAFVPAWGQSSDTIPTTPGKFMLTFDNVSLPSGDKMGLVGGSMLFGMTDWFSVGPAAYDALTGRRGGFITIGLAGEIEKKLAEYFSINSALFVGAGGRESSMVGGGLMLRPSLGFNVHTGKLGNIGAGVSYITFPNGQIHSTQPYISYEYPFDTLLVTGWLNCPFLFCSSNEGMPAVENEFAIVYQTDFVPAGVRTEAGGLQYGTVNLLGAEWYHYINPNWFVKLESEGAMGGRSDGYMQILLGPGYRFGVTPSTFVKLAGQIGAGGGGNISTGGGLLLDGRLSVQQYFTRSLYLSAGVGYVDAPNGDFKATTASLQLGYGYDSPNVTSAPITLSDLKGYLPRHLRLRATNQTYFQGHANWRRRNQNDNVNLLGLQIDYFVNNYMYLTGQGIGAYQGFAGAYMTGLIGPGLLVPLFSTPFFLDGETLVGAAGGGGLNVGGGFVLQGNAGLGYQLSKSFSVMGYYGYITAPGNFLRANILGLTIGYNFSLFTKNRDC